MIRITQRADEPSGTPDRPCYYDAETEVDGVRFAARARYGVNHNLARQLVAAGISDQAVEITTFGICGVLTYPSLHWMAQRTIAEGPTTPICERKFTDPAEHSVRELDQSPFYAPFPRQGIRLPSDRNRLINCPLCGPYDGGADG